jgi:hypothetical protein
MDAGRLAAFARAQRGLFTRVQARSCGFSEYQVRRRLEAGEWKVVLGRVLATGEHLITPAVTDRAAALLVPHAVLTAASAARVYGIAVADPRTFLWIDTARRRPLPGVVYLHDPLSPRTSPSARDCGWLDPTERCSTRSGSSTNETHRPSWTAPCRPVTSPIQIWYAGSETTMDDRATVAWSGSCG